MPKIKSPTVKAYYDKSEDCEARVIENFKIGEESTALVLVNDHDGIKRAFSTNIKISESIAHYLFRFYQARWGIETGHRNLDHDFKARTTSKNYNIRLFYFLFSVCLYNLWVLVNICVSIAIYGRIKDKPVITAKLFAIVLYRISIDPGG
jgi:putative transposase